MAELDFVLEMAAKDDPETWQFTRPGTDNSTPPVIMASWADRLAGKALVMIRRATGYEQAQQGVKAWEARQQTARAIPLGFSKGGKKVDGVDH